MLLSRTKSRGWGGGGYEASPMNYRTCVIRHICKRLNDTDITRSWELLKNINNTLVPNGTITFYFILSSELRPLKMDGWMTCDFTSFSTVFQSYQDDGKLILKGCVQWNSVYG